MTDRQRTSLRSGLFFVLSLLSVLAFHDAGLRYHGFRQIYGVAGMEMHPSEIILFVWHAAFGSMAVAFLALAFFDTRLPARIEARLSAWFQSRWFLPAATLVLLIEVLAIKHWVLEHAYVSDDEAVYVFIAKTLMKLRVVNPLPGPRSFFAGQFLVINSAGWFGKYPIGHPLLLAVGEVLHLRVLVVPLVCCGVLAATHAVASRLAGRKVAGVSVCLLLVSPHFVFTGATELSQPAETLAAMLAVLAMLRAREGLSGRWMAIAGGLWGFGVMVRPLPGVLFALAAALWVVWQWRELPLRRRLELLAVGAVPFAAWIGAFLAVNAAQTGRALESGYDAFHGPQYGILAAHGGFMSNSLGGALVRQNAWLFGWPSSFLFLPFVIRHRALWLVWAMVIAEYAYRLLVPKVFVGTTGPTYVAEIVPLLAVATAMGLAELRAHLPAGGELRTRGLAATVMALVGVSMLTFVPIQMREIERSSASTQVVFQLLQKAGAARAVVFTNFITRYEGGDSWNTAPPPPSPDLDDDVVFLRHRRGPTAAAESFDFWKSRLSDRSAWVFEFDRERAILKPVLSPEDLVRPEEKPQ
jgi:hypothetical protein